MKKGSVIAGIVVCFLVVAVGSAFAVEITADTLPKMGKRSGTGKVYVKDNKSRVERAGTPYINIVRGDKNLFWQINGYERTYIEAKLNPAMKPWTEEKIPGEVGRKQVGTETIDGHPAKKYEVSVKEPKKTETYYQWFATDVSFPVKIATTNGSWSIEYKNIKKGGAPDSMFEIPKGVEKDLTAVPDVLSGGGH